MLAVFKQLYYTADDQKMADKKKMGYQEGLEKSRADSAALSRDSYMKDPEKSCARSHESYMKDQEKSRADSAARSHEHRRRNRGAWGTSVRPIYCYVLRSLQLSKTDI